MKTPKTLSVIECRKCGGSYYAGKHRITLHPGTEDELPDELSFVIRKVSACVSCRQQEDRTKGGKRKRFER
jgi:hypothetical protein